MSELHSSTPSQLDPSSIPRDLKSNETEEEKRAAASAQAKFREDHREELREARRLKVPKCSREEIISAANDPDYEKKRGITNYFLCRVDLCGAMLKGGGGARRHWKFTHDLSVEQILERFPGSPISCPGLFKTYSQSSASSRVRKGRFRRDMDSVRAWLVIEEFERGKDMAAILSDNPGTKGSSVRHKLFLLRLSAYLEKNPAHGIRLRETEAKKQRRFYSPDQVRKLLTELPEPCRTIVLLAVLTGMRIGEILALRWKRVDLLRGTIEVAETFSDGEFGSPKTRSSRRIIPISMELLRILEVHYQKSLRNQTEDLLFCTPKGTPMSPKNLYNRALAPACDRTGQPRVSWHSFRHTHATLLGDSGESLKTAQALLGHSDLETTLNTYMHVIPDSQRRAVDRVAGVLFSDVLKTDGTEKEGRYN